MLNYLSSPFKWFFKLEAASGLVLLFAAIIALIISNSGLAELYFSSLNKYLFIGINNFGLKLSVHHWINDALMAIFFFFVTLEIKREFIQGELSNIKQAMLPIIAAVGGMVVPALFYIFINWGNSINPYCSSAQEFGSPLCGQCALRWLRWLRSVLMRWTIIATT